MHLRPVTVDRALEQVEKKSGKDPLEIFIVALNNIKPMVEVKSRRVGGANYQVPVEGRPGRRVRLAVRWRKESARNRGREAVAAGAGTSEPARGGRARLGWRAVPGRGGLEAADPYLAIAEETVGRAQRLFDRSGRIPCVHPIQIDVARLQAAQRLLALRDDRLATRAAAIRIAAI